MTTLVPEQVEALRDLHGVCRDLGIDLVVIGATALRVWLPDEHRLTEDIDVAVALDLDEFAPLVARLTDLGWHPDRRWAPRWHSPRGARVDLLPLGARARQQKQIVWPRADTRMRVVGYDRAFRDAVLHELAPGLQIRVIPLPILALLKVVGYMDHPALRQKDLGDLLMIIDRYEENTDRRFSDDVLEAGVEYDEAGAFLLGQDLRLLCVAPDEVESVRQFLRQVTDGDFQVPARLLQRARADDDHDSPYARQFAALARGFGEPAGGA